MKNNLLIISCSHSGKVSTPGLIPAIDLLSHLKVAFRLHISARRQDAIQISLGMETSNRKRFYTETAGPQKPYIGETPATSGVATTTTLKRRFHNGRTTQENHSNTRAI